MSGTNFQSFLDAAFSSARNAMNNVVANPTSVTNSGCIVIWG